MNILVLSDSHRAHVPVRKLLSVYEKQIGFAVHLGDHADDLLRYENDYPKIKMYAVPGNCDYPSFGETETVLRVNGKKILLTHGHRQAVKMSLDRIGYYALERGVDACLFGHTHEPVIFDVQSVFFMNPGSLGRPNRGKPGYGLLRVTDEGVITGALLTLK